jgi:hypothetical protein
MNTLPISTSVRRLSGPRLLSAIALIATVYVGSSSLFAQAPTDGQTRRRGGDQTDGSDRRNMTPQDMQARMLAGLKERFEVTDDEEWKVISDRLAKVMELRRNTAGGGFGGFGGRGGPGGGTPGGDSTRGTRGSRGTGGGSPEVAALSSALRDKLPDAEIKSRLERVREMRKENEAKLSKAQEELRTVLSVRQEATAVVFGLLP